MFNYYGKSKEALKELLKERESVTKEEWDEYKTHKPLLGSCSFLAIKGLNDNQWDVFLDMIRKEMQRKE